MNLYNEKKVSEFSYSEIAKACDVQRGYACRAILHPEQVSYRVFKRIANFLGVDTVDAAAIWKTAKEEDKAVKSKKFIASKIEE